MKKRKLLELIEAIKAYVREKGKATYLEIAEKFELHENYAAQLCAAIGATDEFTYHRPTKTLYVKEEFERVLAAIREAEQLLRTFRRSRKVKGKTPTSYEGVLSVIKYDRKRRAK